MGLGNNDNVQRSWLNWLIDCFIQEYCHETNVLHRVSRKQSLCWWLSWPARCHQVEGGRVRVSGGWRTLSLVPSVLQVTWFLRTILFPYHNIIINLLNRVPASNTCTGVSAAEKQTTRTPALDFPEGDLPLKYCDKCKPGEGLDEDDMRMLSLKRSDGKPPHLVGGPFRLMLLNISKNHYILFLRP